MMSDIDDAAIEVLQKPPDYFGEINDLVEQGWGGTFHVHRDSDTVDRCNWTSVIKIMEEKGYENDIHVSSNNHWAVGWLDTLMVRVLRCKCDEDAGFEPSIRRHPDWESKGVKVWKCHNCLTIAQYTDAFVEALEIRARLEDYPILDEDKLSEMEHNEMYEWLEQEVGAKFASELQTHLYDEYSASHPDDVRWEWIKKWKEANNIA